MYRYVYITFADHVDLNLFHGRHSARLSPGQLPSRLRCPALPLSPRPTPSCWTMSKLGPMPTGSNTALRLPEQAYDCIDRLHIAWLHIYRRMTFVGICVM